MRVEKRSRAIPCSVKSCKNSIHHKSKLLCSAHLWRLRKYGSVLSKTPIRLKRPKGSRQVDIPGRASWASMISRCNNPNRSNYKYYGGRGIKVCRRWKKFENFLADMGRKPPGKSLDRIDNNKGYSPSNCKWSSKSEQMKNRRSWEWVRN